MRERNPQTTAIALAFVLTMLTAGPWLPASAQTDGPRSATKAKDAEKQDTEPEFCSGSIQTSSGDGVIHGGCVGMGAAEPPATARVAASVDDLLFVSAEEVLFARRGCTELAPAAPAPADAGQWLCPIRPAASPTPPASGVAAIARQAGLRLIARRGTVGVLPARTLVGLPTYFWLDGVTRRAAQHTQDGWRLGIVAQPVGYTWRFGDGEELTGGPGQAQPPQTSQIRHTYRQLGFYDVAVQVSWHVTFRVNGRTLDAPGEFTTTATTTLAVDELRARLTS
jgi:hypothetical protein